MTRQNETPGGLPGVEATDTTTQRCSCLTHIIHEDTELSNHRGGES